MPSAGYQFYAFSRLKGHNLKGEPIMIDPALSQIALLIAGAVALHLKTAKGANWKPLAVGAALVAVLAALMRF